MMSSPRFDTTARSPGLQPRASDTRVKVVIVEDDRTTREGLVSLVRKSPDLQLVDAYADGEAAIRGVAHDPPDVVVMDLNLTAPGSSRLNGTDCVAALKAAHARLQVIMLTVYDDADRIFESLRAGASCSRRRSTGRCGCGTLPHQRSTIASTQVDCDCLWRCGPVTAWTRMAISFA